MTESDEAHATEISASVTQRQSRVFWTAAVLAIGAMLLLCAFLVLIAAARS